MNNAMAENRSRLISHSPIRDSSARVTRTRKRSCERYDQTKNYQRASRPEAEPDVASHFSGAMSPVNRFRKGTDEVHNSVIDF